MAYRNIQFGKISTKKKQKTDIRIENVSYFLILNTLKFCLCFFSLF